MARIHAQCFVATPRPWSAAEIADLIDGPGSFLLTGDDAFLIGRTMADEAELLTVAVAPIARRRGQGRILLARFADAARARGANRAFLEVASDNMPAQALYQAGGWIQAGVRRNYYAPGINALVMTLALVQQ